MLIKESWILYSCMKLVKSDNQFLHDYFFFFFLEAMSFVLEPTGMIISNSHNFAIWKCYSRFNSTDQYAQIEGIVLMVYWRGVTSWIIQSYTSYLDLIGNHWFSESFWLS